jgi:hypothetical protein
MLPPKAAWARVRKLLKSFGDKSCSLEDRDGSDAARVAEPTAAIRSSDVGVIALADGFRQDGIFAGCIIPHAEFGDPACSGSLTGRDLGHMAEVFCNVCGEVIAYAPTENLTQILNAMELTLGVTTTRCPHCGTIDLLPGLSRLEAFVRPGCGKGGANAG